MHTYKELYIYFWFKSINCASQQSRIVLQEYWACETSSTIPLTLSVFLADLNFLDFKSLVFLVHIPIPLRFQSLHLTECLSFLRKPAGRCVSRMAQVTQYFWAWLNLKGLDKCCILKVWQVLHSLTVEFRQAINGKSRLWKINLCHEQRSYILQGFFFFYDLKWRKYWYLSVDTVSSFHHRDCSASEKINCLGRRDLLVENLEMSISENQQLYFWRLKSGTGEYL